MMRLKVVFVISSLSCGGSERVVTNMANYWARKGWEIFVLTFDNRSIAPFYNLDPSVCYQPLGIAGSSSNIIKAISSNISRLKILRGAINVNKPDVLISFGDRTNVLTVIATKGLKIPIVVSERTAPNIDYIKNIWRKLRDWSYTQSDCLVVPTKGARDYFSFISSNRISVIPNPVLKPIETSFFQCSRFKKPVVISMGRLSEVKRFDLLLEAFSRVKDGHSDWMLVILGEGSERSKLEEITDQFGLKEKVWLPGKVRNPGEWLQQADLFVTSSRFEGFPNSLCEAMSFGVPVISTDCPMGPREIIRNGVDGLLVPNGDSIALAHAIDRLMTDETERQRLASRAPEIIERFSLEKVMKLWEDLLDEVLSD